MTPWDDFVKSVEDARDSLGFKADQRCFYRGHSSSSWTLTPTLFRERTTAPEIDELERLLYAEFSSRARELQSTGLSGWDVLFHMRHHGVPTRLLDWTEVLAVSVYFALEGYDKNSGNAPCIWLLNPYALNKESWWNWEGLLQPKYLGSEFEGDTYYDYSDFLENEWQWGWKMPVAITPVQKNSRMHAQRGWFTIHGDRIEPLEKQCKGVVRRIDIPHRAVPDAKRFLEWAGIDQYLLYADLDGLSQTLMERYCPRDGSRLKKKTSSPSKL